MLDLTFKCIAPDTYQKWNELLGVRTTLWFHGVGAERKVTVRHEQPKQLIADILDMNVTRQNDFKGFKGVEMYQGTSVPLAVHAQIKKMCGFQPGHGYDEKRYKRIVNDSDYQKLRTVPGKI